MCKRKYTFQKYTQNYHEQLNLGSKIVEEFSPLFSCISRPSFFMYAFVQRPCRSKTQEKHEARGPWVVQRLSTYPGGHPGVPESSPTLGSLQGAQCGTRFWDSRMTPWVGAQPLNHPGTPSLMLFLSFRPAWSLYKRIHKERWSRNTGKKRGKFFHNLTAQI